MKGFSLIELMVTVAIVAILAAIAYPSYVEYVNRSRRADAKATLVELAQWMERNYMTNLSYIVTDNNSNDITATRLQNYLVGRGVLDDYSFAPANLSGNAFTLNATPQGAQASDRCGVLTLTSTGVRCVNSGASCSTGNAAAKQAVEQCWR